MNNEETNEILKQILKWVKLQGIEGLRMKARDKNLFGDLKDILAYHHSNGEKSSRDLAKIAGVSHGTIQTLWKKWVDAGIAEPTEKYGGGRCKRLFKLDELGLELPKK